MQKQPHIIQFPSNGGLEIGYIAIGENLKAIPFEMKRIFWAYYTPDSVLRGRHAHHETEMILIAAAGRILITTEMKGKKHEVFVLEKPNEGLYLPHMCWHTMQYSHNAVQLVVASTLYDESDYIRNYEDYQELIK